LRLLLIRPPNRHTVETEVPKAVEAENVSYPPLALLVLATFLRGASRHAVAILDGQLDDLDDAALEARIREFAPDVVGIGAFTVQLVDVVHTVEIARKAGAKRIVLGGPHVNDFPAEARGLPGVDAVVRGEGQVPLLALLDAWEEGLEPRGIPGVMVHPDDPVPDPVWLGDDLDTYPIPNRTLVDPTRYRDVLGGGKLFTTLVTSRGCPHRCTFCNTPRHKYRTMSPRRICDEIQSCLDLGIGEVYFVDDTFNVTNDRVSTLCDEILHRKLVFSWTVRMRVKGVDEPLLRKMKAAGCGRIQFGVEQGTQEGLDRLQKGVTIAEIERTFRLCRKVRIRTVAYFLIGTPTERTPDDVRRTIRYSVRLRPDFVMFNILTPFPGTRLFDEGVKEGVLDPAPWNRFITHPTPDFRPQLWEQHLKRDQLRDLLQHAYRRFYWRPTFVVKNILQVRHPDDLLRKAKAGVRLLLGR